MRARVGLIAIIAGALAVAWLIRFACDDAFISYVYSRNLVYGDGLTWFGDHVEGYTNFGWVLWCAIGIAVGVSPLAWAWFGSLTALAACLALTYRIARLRDASATTALCAVALLATNYTFLAFATSGLETMAQCALLTGAWHEVERLRRAPADAPLRARRIALLSVVAALALWTRLDSAVYLLVLGIGAAHALVTRRASATSWAAALGPALVLVGGWLAWKLSYYGEILPNTFHAKVEVSTASLWWATTFVGGFLREYVLWLPLLALLVVAAMRRRFTARLPAAIVAAWFGYVIVTGGDFMEFRFFVAILPPLFIVIAETLTADDAPPRQLAPSVRAIVLVGFLAGISIHHGRTYGGSPDDANDSVPKLANFYGVIFDDNWSMLGTPIGDVLHDMDAVIACNGAGALPYFADIRTVDQLGLNDRWIARNGVKPPPEYVRPGHQRFAPLEYLRERKVNFVIGTPRLVERGIVVRIGLTRGVLGWIAALLGPTPVRVDALDVVAVPVTPRVSLLMWYLTPTPEITARIRAAGWEYRTFHRTTTAQPMPAL